MAIWARKGGVQLQPNFGPPAPTPKPFKTTATCKRNMVSIPLNKNNSLHNKQHNVNNNNNNNNNNNRLNKLAAKPPNQRGTGSRPC